MSPLLLKSQTAGPEKLLSADKVGDEVEAKELDIIILPSPKSSLSKSRDLSSTSTVQGSLISLGSSFGTQVEIDPLIRLTRVNFPVRRFKVLQQFEGVVTELTDDALIADLIDLTDKSKPCEVVEIPFIEIPPADQSILTPGCVFYWILGYEMSLGGQKSRVSEIRLRRNPIWSQNEIEAITAQGKDFFRQFGGSEKDTS